MSTPKTKRHKTPRGREVDIQPTLPTMAPAKVTFCDICENASDLCTCKRKPRDDSRLQASHDSFMAFQQGPEDPIAIPFTAPKLLTKPANEAAEAAFNAPPIAAPGEGVLVLAEQHGDGWTFYNADCIQLARQLPSNSVGFALHSPPFAATYIYSDAADDMGNCTNDAQFIEHYRFLVREQLRVLMPGRLVAVHCKDLVNYAGSSGRAGLRDFPGDIIRLYESEGFQFHSRVTVWKCPVTERARTNAHGLLYKTLRADGSFARQGLAEYVIVFRKWPRDEAEQALADSHPVRHWNPTPKPGDPIEEPTGDAFPLPQWQEWASPVWMDIDQTNVLNAEVAREDADEKHMCPLQLDLIERCIVLWSNPGDVVWSAFGGIASEGVVALQQGRKIVLSELKPAYWKRGCMNLAAVGQQQTLLGV